MLEMFRRRVSLGGGGASWIREVCITCVQLRRRPLAWARGAFYSEWLPPPDRRICTWKWPIHAAGYEGKGKYPNLGDFPLPYPWEPPYVPTVSSTVGVMDYLP